MRFADDLVVYNMPRRRLIDYGYSVDDAELARVETAARNISNQTIDEADHLRAVSRRNDLIAIDRANRLMEAAAQPLPTAHLRAHYHPKAADFHALEQAQSLSHRAQRSMSMSDLSKLDDIDFERRRIHRHYPSHRVVVVPAYPHYYPNYFFYNHPEARYLPPVPHHYYPHLHHQHLPHEPYLVRRAVPSQPAHAPAPPISDYRRRLERRLDTELLNFEFPTAEHFLSLKDHLRGVNDKLLAHRLLLDRYAGIEMAAPDSVEHNVESKCSAILARMPNRTQRRSSDDDIRVKTPAIPSHHLTPCEAPVSQIRHRIKKLVDRSKNQPHHY